KTTYADVVRRGLDSARFDLDLYQLAFAEHDPAEMERQVERSKGIPGVEDEILASEANTAAYYGRLSEAREFSRQAAESAKRSNLEEAAAIYYSLSGLREALFGNNAEAARATAARSLPTGRDAEYATALNFAFAGNTQRAHALAADLEKRFPEDTIVQYNYLPTIRARIALDDGHASDAIAALESARAYELGETTDSTIGWTAMYPVYVRGLAYLASRQGTAAAEFQRILDHPGLVLNAPIGALAHLQIARAYALEAQSSQRPDASAAHTKAIAAYQDFLTLWKDADSDIPILKQAKAEYAKLQ
ncbi:MAG TPA: hypothetical protein VKW78_15470, partial [Terriglobales bacterium]|nr:hypothetical protein [Terriglobales bacterium]